MRWLSVARQSEGVAEVDLGEERAVEVAGQKAEGGGAVNGGGVEEGGAFDALTLVGVGEFGGVVEGAGGLAPGKLLEFVERQGGGEQEGEHVRRAS
jgi:hypothetical protein